jgi:uncharacterized membrane protein
MAGIGFELQKLLKKGGIGSFFKVALAGIIIVAGPWILAILGILLVGSIAGHALVESQELFMAVIIYSYAVSLFLFGGSHYIFTRYLSDLIYLEKKRESGAALLFFLALIFFLASLIAYLGLRKVNVSGISHPLMFKLSAWLFFANVNILWVVMIFISLLKRFMTIFIVYLVGMICSVLGVFFIGRAFALGGAMLGFALGQIFTTLSLLIMSLKNFRPGRWISTIKGFFVYFPKYGFLFLAGMFYYWGIWIDKFVFWFGAGTKVGSGYFRLFPAYDLPVYIANLAMIPGLIYFVVISETDFYTHLKEFIQSLGDSIYARIQEKKYALIAQMKKGLWEQSVFQGVLTLIFILLAPTVSTILFAGSMDMTIFRITLAAVFMHFLYLTLMTYLFYFEMYREAFLSSLTLFLVNFAAAYITVLAESTYLSGLSYLLSCSIASAVAAVFLFSAARAIDRTVYARYSA